MKNQFIRLILLSAILLAGCTLSATDVEQAISIIATPVETTNSTISMTQPAQTGNPTVIPPSQEVPQLTETIAPGQVLLDNCAILHPEWSIYTVKPGDTLANIASLFGTSVNVLTQVNCLVDANRIYVGQKLHVPPTFIPPEPVEPPPSLPLIDMGPPSSGVCVVVPNGEQASVRDIVFPEQTVAILLGTVRFIRHADAAYIVELPFNDREGMVYISEAHLIGSTCSEQPDNGSGANPSIPTNLPVIHNGGEPSGNLCSVVKEPSPGTRYIYGGTSNAHAPIAIMGDYLLFLSEINGGYLVVLPGWDMNGWIPADGVTLFGSGC